MPPTYLTTTKRALRYLATGNLGKYIDDAIQALAEDVDAALGDHEYAEVLTSQSTLTGTPIDLTTVGPSISLVVPTNGLVVLFAQADITGGAAPGKVYVVEDAGTPVEVISVSATVTGYTAPGITGGVSERLRAGALTFPASAGSHTYKLQYSSAGAPGTAFANRKIRGCILTPS